MFKAKRTQLYHYGWNVCQYIEWITYWKIFSNFNNKLFSRSILDKRRISLEISRRTNNEEIIKCLHSDKVFEEFFWIKNGQIVDNILSIRTRSYFNTKYNFKSVSSIIESACWIAADPTINLTKSIVENELDFAFAYVRPADHHSSTDQVGTFCGFLPSTPSVEPALYILNFQFTNCDDCCRYLKKKIPVFISVS
jgi:hypothetical protein